MSRTLTLGSLFAGIGGMDLGFERAGFTTAWQVEIEPYCQKVLAKHFPHAERYADVRECGKHNLRPVDVIAGGFPCQDISVAGRMAGLEGERSGLWYEMLRIIGELRPTWVLVENVPNLRTKGYDTVAAGLEEEGYAIAQGVVGAWAVGALHKRDRCWILGYSKHNGSPSSSLRGCDAQAVLGRSQGSQEALESEGASSPVDVSPTPIPHSQFTRLEGHSGHGDRQAGRQEPTRSIGEGGLREEYGSDTWSVEPDVGRVADGVPDRVDRIKCLGNAVVPLVPYHFANFIKQFTQGH